METSIRITIRAPYERIFPLAARVEDWGRILPHYRFVKLLGRKGNRKLVRMSARRDFIPVTWTAIETIEEGSVDNPGRILFHHVKGLVRGMDVQWTFEPVPEKGEVIVQIAHQLPHPTFPVRLLRPRLIKIVVGEGFIGNIAGKTLKRIKQLAEEPNI